MTRLTMKPIRKKVLKRIFLHRQKNLCRYSIRTFERLNTYIEETESSEIRTEYTNRVFTYLWELKPGDSFKIGSVVKLRNVRSFIQACCAFVWIHPERQIYFNGSWSEVYRDVYPSPNSIVKRVPSEAPVESEK